MTPMTHTKLSGERGCEKQKHISLSSKHVLYFFRTPLRLSLSHSSSLSFFFCEEDIFAHMIIICLKLGFADGLTGLASAIRMPLSFAAIHCIENRDIDLNK